MIYVNINVVRDAIKISNLKEENKKLIKENKDLWNFIAAAIRSNGGKLEIKRMHLITMPINFEIVKTENIELDTIIYKFKEEPNEGPNEIWTALESIRNKNNGALVDYMQNELLRVANKAKFQYEEMIEDLYGEE